MSGVVRHVPRRASAAMLDRLKHAGVATVHEVSGKQGLLFSYMRPIFPEARVAGSAVTVLCAPGDNLMIHVAVEQCGRGDVLVVATTSAAEQGVIGELLATSLVARGVVGAVVDTGIRDITELKRMQFPIWSRAISAQGTAKAVAGSVNVPVICAGQLVHPGDVVVGDEDGVVCVPRSSAAVVAKGCDERLAREAAVRERLSEGELGLDIYELRDHVARLGITYDDR